MRDRILKDECWAALAQRNPRVFYPASLETYGRLCICLRDNRVVHSTRLAGNQREGKEGEGKPKRTAAAVPGAQCFPNSFPSASTTWGGQRLLAPFGIKKYT